MKKETKRCQGRCGGTDEFGVTSYLLKLITAFSNKKDRFCKDCVKKEAREIYKHNKRGSE